MALPFDLAGRWSGWENLRNEVAHLLAVIGGVFPTTQRIELQIELAFQPIDHLGIEAVEAFLIEQTVESILALDQEMQRRARKRASELGISLAEYVRRLVAGDLGDSQAKADPVLVFDLGSSGGSDIAKEKSAMIGEALAGVSRRPRRR